MKLDDTIVRVLQRVAELPDRTSPDDWPEAMLVTGEELDRILREELAAAPASDEGRELREAAEALLESCETPDGLTVPPTVAAVEDLRRALSHDPEKENA